jgi:hypothetical protein
LASPPPSIPDDTVLELVEEHQTESSDKADRSEVEAELLEPSDINVEMKDQKKLRRRHKAI